ncbi:MAG: DUF4340 domain-containing protein [Butyricicoccaceae bacterium]
MKHKKLIAAALAVAALGGVYAWLMLHPAAEEDADDEEQTILSIEESKLSRITVTPTEGDAFSIRIQQEDDSTVYTMDDSKHDYDDTQMSALASAVCDLSGHAVETDSTNLDSYGLSAEDDPFSVTVQLDGDSTQTILLGKQNSALGGTYCRLDGSEDVYLLDEDTVEQLTADLMSYRQLLVAGGYYDLYSDAQSLTVSGPGRKTLTIERRDTDSLREDAASSYSEFILTAPVQCDADDTVLSDGLLTGLQYALTAYDIVEDDPADLSQYGLDNPVTVRVRTDNADFTVLIGKEDGDGGRYLMRKDGNTVFCSDESDFDFLDSDWSAWRSRKLLSFGLTELKCITFSDGKTTHRVNFTQTDEEDEDGETTRTTTSKLDGETMSEDAMNALYTNYSAIRFTEALSDTPSRDADYTVTVERTDGTKSTIRFVKYASRTYAANVDGSSEWFAVSQDTLTTLQDCLTVGDTDDADETDEGE